MISAAPPPPQDTTAKSSGGNALPRPTSRKGQLDISSGRQGATVAGSAECEQTHDSCKWCAEHPFEVCRACARLGRSAVRLLDKGGLSVEQVAEMLGLDVARMQRLAEEERQRRDLLQYKRDRIPLEPIQALFARRQEEDPTLSQARATRLAGYTSRVEFLRTMGLARTASFVRKGKRYPGKYRAEISVEAAGRIVRAIGYAPHEIKEL